MAVDRRENGPGKDLLIFDVLSPTVATLHNNVEIDEGFDITLMQD